MTTQTLLKTKTKSKVIKISSKNQITIPKQFLDYMNLTGGSNITIQFQNGKIEIINQKEVAKNRLKNFKPYNLGDGIVVDISATHNDIYDY